MGAATAGTTAGSAPIARGAVTVDQRFEMPSTGSLRISGHGYGHGRGMSQYGAQGAARLGRSWKQIVAFYYPGTTLDSTSRRLRVLISGDTSRDVLVKARSGLQLQDLGAKRRWTLPGGSSRWRLTVDRRGRSVVDRYTGRWSRWRTLAGEGQFSAGGEPISLIADGGVVRRYRGKLRAARPAPGSTDRDTVNVISIEAYLRGVVPREMPASWHPQAVRAQAVAARTYASYEADHPRARHYQICDTTSCQVYGGVDAEQRGSDAAIAATRGQFLTWRGKPAFTQFGSSSGGQIAAGSQPYQVTKADPWDDWSGNPVHDWSTTVDVSRIERAYPAVGDLREIRVTARDGHGQWEGRIQRLTLVGARGRVATTGDDFRMRLGLRSTWLTFPGR